MKPPMNKRPGDYWTDDEIKRMAPWWAHQRRVKSYVEFTALIVLAILMVVWALA